MKFNFELTPTIGIYPIKLGESRECIPKLMNETPKSFMKTKMSKHPTDLFFESGFQIFYGGDEPVVDYIELSRCCNFNVTFSGVNVLELPVEDVLNKVEEITGIKPISEDGGYSYEILSLGICFWRPSIESEFDDGKYFSTVGIGEPRT